MGCRSAEKKGRNIMISIDENRCVGCGQCVRDCFPEDILLQGGKAVPKNEKCFECGHCIAVCPVNAVSLNGYDMSEVEELEEMGTKLDPQAFLNQMKSRRSIRQFRDTPVTDQQLEMILEAGRYAPTGGNRQNVAYTVIRKDLPQIREQLIRQLGAAGKKMLAEGRRASFYTDMWLDMERDYCENAADRLFFNAGTVIAVSSDDPISAGVASAHMETMIYSLGLGMLYSGFSRFAIESSEEIRKELGIREDYHVHTVLVIGTPAVKFRRTVPRKKADVTWR